MAYLKQDSRFKIPHRFKRTFLREIHKFPTGNSQFHVGNPQFHMGNPQFHVGNPRFAMVNSISPCRLSRAWLRPAVLYLSFILVK
jgi:hypothetical protein